MGWNPELVVDSKPKTPFVPRSRVRRPPLGSHVWTSGGETIRDANGHPLIPIRRIFTVFPGGKV